MSFAAAEPTTSLYELKTIKTGAGVTFEVHAVKEVKWSQEYPATLRVTPPAPNCVLLCSPDLMLEKLVYRKEDFVIEDGFVSIEVPVKVITSGDINVEIRFALCNKVSCYPQRAEVVVSF